jgi:hypothetical protein
MFGRLMHHGYGLKYRWLKGVEEADNANKTV